MILAFDLGRNLGWFMGRAVGPCEWGTILLKDTTDLGAFLKSADDPLRDLLPRASTVVVEKPNTAGESAYFAIRKNMALLGHLHYWSAWYGLQIRAEDEISVMTGKLTLAGHGRADKDQMIAAARERGYDVQTEHEADACGIWFVATFGAAPRNKPKPRSSKGRSLKAEGLL